MAIDRYDALTPPDPAAWLRLGEEERLGMIIAYHHSIGDQGENDRPHCLLHGIIENQIAMGGVMQPVEEKLRQLLAQGLDRHQALHAIAFALYKHMLRLGQQGKPAGDQTERYLKDVRRMTVQKYLALIRD